MINLDHMQTLDTKDKTIVITIPKYLAPQSVNKMREQICEAITSSGIECNGCLVVQEGIKVEAKAFEKETTRKKSSKQKTNDEL